jgi:hypothetical protein
MSNTYLLISPEDFFAIKRKWPYSDRFAFIESVLKYLERHDIPHMHCYDSIRIYPTDHFHAREICDHFRITEVKYFVNGKLSNLFKEKERAKRSDRMVHLGDGSKVSMRQFSVLANKRAKERAQEKIVSMQAVQISFPENRPFIGSFIDFKPRLGLFWDLECGIQGSFIR